MPRWAVRHLTTYRYSVDVTFAPHLLRLTPRQDRASILSRRLHVSPQPAAVSEELDAFGNSCTRLSFDLTLASELRIESQLELETPDARSPVAPLAPQLPWWPPGNELQPFGDTAQHPDVHAFAQSLAAQVNYEPLPFLERLNRELHARTDRQLRVEGAAQAPEQTLASARGACRDLSVLLLAACRSLGMAGRFVSGYQGQEQTPDGRRHLHAWAEIWLPGLGFVGFDPMHGVAVGSGHIALAAAPDQAPTMPIEGGYYFDGPSLTSTLDYSIEMWPI